MRLNTPLKPVPALLALMLAGCGGGGHSAGPQGDTLLQPAVSTTGVQLACIDANQNWQCDDGDLSRVQTGSEAAGATGLSAVAGRYTLLETRDASNRRTGLLVSEAGSATVTGTSTLRTFLGAAGRSAAQVSAAEAVASPAQLASAYASAVAQGPLALAALDATSRAVADQRSPSPTLAAYAPSVGSLSTDARWDSSEDASVRRQLSTQGSVALNNAESNRLYLFDASASSVQSQEIDLLPAPTAALASAAPWWRQSVRWIAQATSLFVDTASAATGIVGTPTTGAPVVLAPGKGIAAVQLVNGGNDALVLMNMLAGGYTGSNCVGTSEGNEGLFRVALSGTSSYRNLAQAPACVHSGFNLVAADAAGSRVAAWDQTAARLWLLDGTTLQRTATLDLGLDASQPPQALAVSAGGRYLAVLSAARATLVDLQAGRVITQLSGNWGSVSGASFAAGGRRLLVSSGATVHTVLLDDALQFISQRSTAAVASTQTLRALSVSADGDSYVLASDALLQWRAVADDRLLASVDLPAGLSVQQAALAGSRVVLLARGTQDQQFKLMRLPLGLPTAPR